MPKLRSRAQGAAVPLDEADKRLLNALQSRFPLDPRPFAAVAAELGVDEADVLDRASHLLRERIIREIRRRTRVVGAFPDGNSALMLVAARLRHIASTKWGKRRYLVMEKLLNPAKHDQEAAA